MQRVLDFLKTCQTYFLATCDADSQPHVRPFGTIDVFDGKLCFQTGRSKPTSKQIHDNPKVELCAYDGAKWLRLSASAVEEPRIAAQEQMLEAYPELKALYAPGDGNTEIFKLEDCVATFYSFSEPPLTIRF